MAGPAELERHLREQVAAQERLLAALEAQRQSMGTLATDRLRAALAEAEAAAKALAGLVHGRRSAGPIGARGPGPGVQGSGFSAQGSGSGRSHPHPEPRTTNPEHPTPDARLMALRAQSRDLAERIARANGINRRVTERAAAHFGSLLVTLAGGGGATYAPLAHGQLGVATKTAGLNALIDRVA